MQNWSKFWTFYIGWIQHDIWRVLSLTPIFKPVGWQQPHHNHELQFWEHTCQIDREQCCKQADIVFLQWGGLLPLKRSDGEAMMAMNLALSWEHFKGNRPPHCKKKISACLGHRSPLIRRVCAWHWSLCAAIGGHFRRWQPWWWGVSLAVGRGAYTTTNPTSRNSRNLPR